MTLTALRMSIPFDSDGRLLNEFPCCRCSTQAFGIILNFDLSRTDCRKLVHIALPPLRDAVSQLTSMHQWIACQIAYALQLQMT